MLRPAICGTISNGMKAIIFAAGKGTRLKPLTDDRPKPMVEVLGIPIVGYTIKALPDKVEEAILVVGYRKEQIIDYFGNEYAGKRIVYAHQEEPRGTFHALHVARPFLDGAPFLTINGDDLYAREDLERIIDHPNSMLVAEWGNADRFGVCEVDDRGNLKSLIEKPDRSSGNLVYTGACVLTHDIFDESPVYGKTGEQVLPPSILGMSKKMPVAVLTARFWHPIGYPEDVVSGEKRLREFLV